MWAQQYIAPVAETGFGHRLTAYKIVGHFFGLSYLNISENNQVETRISNISGQCPHAQLRGRTVITKLWAFFGLWGRDRSQSTASERTTRLSSIKLIVGLSVPRVTLTLLVFFQTAGEDFHEINFGDECGVTKGCFLYPDGCHGNSCYVAASWEYIEQNNEIVMEIFGNHHDYVVLGLSTDKTMVTSTQYWLFDFPI